MGTEEYIAPEVFITASSVAKQQAGEHYTGKIDVWNKIKARQAEMDRDDAKEIAALKAAEKKQKEKDAEMQEWAIAIGAIAFLLFLLFIGIYEMVEFCNTTKRCGR
jgi:hypothetical protein